MVTLLLRIRRTFGHRIVGIAVATTMALVMIGGFQIAQPPAAQAAPAGFFAKNCIIPAPSGPGFKGHGCNLYSATSFVKGNRIPNGPPNKYLGACGQGMTMAVIGVFSGPGGFIAAVLLGCATGMAGAAMFGQ